MRLMPRLTVLAATLALSLQIGVASALAQGVAPGGGIGNYTGIGSGLGTPLGTGPSYPNGTTQPTFAPPPPPGGGSAAPTQRAPTLSTIRPPSYPQPRAPFESSPRQPATVPLSLPETPLGDLSFLKGCWRTDVFQQAQHAGTTTYCFDEKGAGRLLYARQDEPEYFCRGPARAGYEGQVLRLRGENASCSDGGSAPDALDCRPSGDTTECTGTAAGGGKVRLYRVR